MKNTEYTSNYYDDRQSLGCPEIVGVDITLTTQPATSFTKSIIKHRGAQIPEK